MAIFCSIFTLCCLTSIVLVSGSDAAAAAAVPTTTTDLATKVCRTTSNYAFCHNAIYSDPRAAGADQYFLSYVALRQAHLNATETLDYITSKLKSMKAGQGSGLLRGLRKCEGYYQEAIRTLTEMMGNLDSETFYGLDKLSIDVEGSIRACEASRGEGSDLSKRNEDLIKLSDICHAVSKLYTYH
ncbi:hypothetical protein CDL12_14105 [Handroanthus impetiginosus]|uniref:Pectinesterase inhibitor domain-containing protein n=1 Tax=Handroanthus impetiginosus TaxID=429701 RepID=A0A2G9H6Y2_9LAMI|nr:hypothetical protein CDL12_14105 [Handroanthus impetiginosus]